MDNSLEELITRLNVLVLEEDFLDRAEEIIEEIGENPNAFDAVEPILVLMENNPEVDYGTPGPLVHFVEGFYKNGYEEKLTDSLTRKPIKHTVWMLNRIINGSEGDTKEYLLKALDKVIFFPNLDASVVSLAQHFRTLHG